MSLPDFRRTGPWPGWFGAFVLSTVVGSLKQRIDSYSGRRTLIASLVVVARAAAVVVLHRRVAPGRASQEANPA